MANPVESRKKLHSALVGGGYYSKSFDDFEAQFSDPDKRATLYKSLNGGGFYTKSQEEFESQYFADITQKKNQLGSDSAPQSQQPSDGSSTFDATTTAGPEQIPFPSVSENEAPVSQSEMIIEKPESSNPIGDFFKSAWNTAYYDIPSTLAGGLAAVLPSNPEFMKQVSPGGVVEVGQLSQQAFDPKNKEELDEGVKATRSELLDWAINRQAAGAEQSKELIRSWDDVHDFVDMMNFTAAAVGQAGVQIPAAVATGGTAAVGQAIGGIYIDEVQQIAQANNITPEEVIANDMDDRAVAIAFGVASGMVEQLGAEKVMGNITKDFVKKSLRSRAIPILSSMTTEGLTEATQSIIEQVGADVGAGEDVSIDLAQVRDEALAGALGGGGVTTIGQAINLINNQNEAQPAAERQAEGEAQGQEQATAAPEVQAEDAAVEEEQRTAETILDSEDDIAAIRESFASFESKTGDIENDFDVWLQELPEAEREVATIRQEEIILTKKLRDIQQGAEQAQEAENQGADTEAVADQGTGEVATAQGEAVQETQVQPVEDAALQEAEQQTTEQITTENEETPTPENQTEVQGKQSSTPQAQVVTEDAGRTVQQVNDDAVQALEQSGVTDAKVKIAAANKSGVNVVVHQDAESTVTKNDDGTYEVRISSTAQNPDHVLGHELAHVAFNKALGDNKKSAPRKRIRSVIESSLKISAQDDAKLKEFLSRYPKSERTDEFLAESLALLSSGKVKLKQSALEKVVAAVQKLAFKVFGTKIQYNIDNDADVRRMFREMASAISGKTGRDLDQIVAGVNSKIYPDVGQVADYAAKYMPQSVSNNPNFDDAVKFIQQNDMVHADQAIAKVVVQQLGFSPFEVTQLFEAALGRKYRGLNPIHQTQNAKYEYFQLFGLFKNFKEKAYRADLNIRNAGTFLWREVRRVEKALDITLPSNLNPYEAFQLWKPRAAYTEKTINDSFFGDGTKKGRANSFLGRLVKAGVTTNEFNEFMAAQHAPERYERIVEMNEDNARRVMRKIELDVHKAGNKDAKGFLPDTKRFPLSPELIDMARQKAKDVPYLAIKLEEKLAEVQRAYKKLNDMAQFQQDTHQKFGPKKLDTARRFYNEFKRDYLDKFVDVLEQGRMIDAKRASFLRNGVSDKSDVVWQSYVPMMIKDEVYADENGEFHDPLGRDFDSMASNVYNNGIHGITGYLDFNIEDMKHPLDVAYHRLINAVKAVEYNDGMRNLADFASKYMSPDRVRIIKSRAVPQVNEFGEVEGVDDYTPDIVKEKGHAYRTTDGKLAYVYFRDPNDGIRAALTSNRFSPTTFSKMLHNFARATNGFLRGLYITFNTSFMVGNPFRDSAEAFANVKSEYNVKGIRRELAKRIGMSIAFFTSEEGPIISRLTPEASQSNLGFMREMAAYWDEAQRVGVRMSWSTVGNPITTKNIQEEIDKLEVAVLNGDKLTARKLASKINDAFLGFADASENIVRLAGYAALRSKGVPAQKAAYIARNITVDFEKRGADKSLNTFVMPLYLFLNVGIQGAGRSAKLLTTKGGRATLGAMFAVYGLNRILLYELAGFLGGDDEEEFKSNYLNNDFIRRNYSLVFNPFDPKNPVKIPKPYSLIRMAATLSENLVDTMYKTRTVGDAAADMVIDATTTFDPVSGGSGNPISFAPFAIFHPVFESPEIFNRDWMNNKVLRARDKGVDAYTYNTSTEARKVHLGNIEIPIGKAYVKMADKGYQWSRGQLDISPTSIEYLIDSYFLKTPPVKSMGNIEDAITEYVNEGDPMKLMKGVGAGLGTRKLYEPIDEKEKQVLFNFFDIADRTPLRGMTDYHFEELQKSLRIIRRKKLASDRTINAWLNTMQLKFPEYERKIERLKGI